MQEAFRTVQEAYRFVQEAFRTVQEAFRTVQKAFRTVQKAYRTVQKAYRSVPCNWCSSTFQGLYIKASWHRVSPRGSGGALIWETILRLFEWKKSLRIFLQITTEPE